MTSSCAAPRRPRRRRLARSRRVSGGLALPAALLAGCAIPSSGAGAPSLIALFATVASVAGTLALLHLLLFAFETRDRRHLFFALLAAAFALVTFLDYRERIGAEVLLAGLGSLQRWAVSAVILAAARFAFSLSSDRAPRRFWVYTAAITALLVIAVPRPDLFDLPAGLLGLAVTFDALATWLT